MGSESESMDASYIRMHLSPFQQGRDFEGGTHARSFAGNENVEFVVSTRGCGKSFVESLVFFPVIAERPYSELSFWGVAFALLCRN